jgi:hypothetical protein
MSAASARRRSEPATARPRPAGPRREAEGELPAHVAPYVRALGAEQAAALLLTFGGSEIYLAEQPRPGTELVRLVGFDGVRRLAEELGHGHHFRVPTARPWLARHLKGKGLSNAAIARTLHVRDDTVRTYLARGGDDRQLRLL